MKFERDENAVYYSLFTKTVFSQFRSKLGIHALGLATGVHGKYFCFVLFFSSVMPPNHCCNMYTRAVRLVCRSTGSEVCLVLLWFPFSKSGLQ